MDSPNNKVSKDRWLSSSLRPLFFWLILIASCKPSMNQDHIVMDIEGFPTVVELNRGENYHYQKVVNGNRVKASIELLDYKLVKEDNYWFDEELGQQNYYMARVEVRVNGRDTLLLARAYQMPVEVEGLRIGVESIKEWEEHGNLEAAKIPDMKKEVRLSMIPAGRPYAPKSIRYPIENYTWHASSYFNTWNSLVPYNHRYYHRGEDMAAIPDILPVVAMFDGKVVASPLPDGDGASNGFMVESSNGLQFRYAHINTESFLSGLDSGVSVTTGQKIGLTGETWDGGRNQTTGPHLHVEWRYRGTKINAYPAMMEAYFRDYPDDVIAVAGGYRFVKMGDQVELDATRSLARPGQKLISYQWITHEGDTVNEPITSLKFDNPGLYSEQLLVTTSSGEQDRDFLQVRVYHQNRGKDIINRHVMYSPVRGINPGDSVLFWNRIRNNYSEVIIDFGDGSNPELIENELVHQYQLPGNYVVSYSTKGADNEPGVLQMEVKVVGKE